MDINNHHFSVTEISQILKELFDGDIFKNLSIYGEIYSIKRGNLTYIDIGDKEKEQKDSPVIRCALSSYSYNPIVDKLNVGDIILVHGSFSYYNKGSSITFWANKIELLENQLGLSLIKKREILLRLEKDGLLTREKKILPRFVSNVGIITAKDSAAYNDIITTLKTRFPTNTRLFPALVQGKDGAKSLINALNLAYKSDVDAIIIGRGGGSKTDLSCFDDEELARTIAKSKVPIITCIGHTIDISICDRISDISAITPTEGASLINPSMDEINELFINYKENLDFYFDEKVNNTLLSISNNLEKLNAYSPSRRLLSMKEKIELNKYNLFSSFDLVLSNYLNMCKNEKEELDRYIDISISNKNQLISSYKSKIEIFNPKMIKEKGYVQIIKEKNIIKSKKKLSSKDEVEIVFLDGSKEAIIK